LRLSVYEDFDLSTEIYQFVVFFNPFPFPCFISALKPVVNASDLQSGIVNPGIS
jgi:hypothetical protein